MIDTLAKYFIIFYFYSIVGYFCEIISIFRLRKEFVWNRGYLLGPYLPVFGFGGILITIFLTQYKEEPLTLFILGMVYCGTLEYLTSLLLEKIFHLRWWDYSQRKFNINGRICLETSVMFGLGAIVLVYFSNTVLFNFINQFPSIVVTTVAIVIFLIMLIDFAISTMEIIRLKSDIKLVGTKDATYELKKKMKESLQKNYYYYERILKAFPHLRISDERIKELSKYLKEKNKRGEKNDEE